MSDKYRRVAEVEVAPMQEETILFHPSKGKFCLLNPTAAFVWQCLESPVSPGDIAERVIDTYTEVESAQAEDDIDKALQQLLELEFVETI